MFYKTNNLKDKEIYLELKETCEAKPKKDWLPAYYFYICRLDGRRIGTCDLRIGHNGKTYIGGNIGYRIYKYYRGHHYAAKACKLLFKLAKKHKMKYVIITCDPKNIASFRTCEIAGGKFIEYAKIPKDYELYKEGRRRSSIFKFKL